VRRQRPHEAAALRALGKQTQAAPTPPNDLYAIPGTSAKHEQLSAERYSFPSSDFAKSASPPLARSSAIDRCSTAHAAPAWNRSISVKFCGRGVHNQGLTEDSPAQTTSFGPDSNLVRRTDDLLALD
jgi:hypothetical protein